MSDETPGAYVLAPGQPRRRFPWLRRRLTLDPYQVGIVIRDGRVAEVFSEGARRLPRGEVRTHVASTAPFNLVFWLKDPGDPSDPEEGIALDQPVLTSDSQPVTGRIDLTLSVVPGNAERLLQLPRSRGVVTPAGVGDAIRAELLAKVLALDIHRHTASELRGNRDLFTGIGASLETELASTIRPIRAESRQLLRQLGYDARRAGAYRGAASPERDPGNRAQERAARSRRG